MAVKKMQEETASMIDTFREFKETKNIDRTTLVSVLEESFRNVLAKIFGSDENFDVIVNPDKGDFEMQMARWRMRTKRSHWLRHARSRLTTRLARM